jgi:hypothetical protein
MENFRRNQILLQKKQKGLQYIKFYKLTESLTGNQIVIQKKSSCF